MDCGDLSPLSKAGLVPPGHSENVRHARDPPSLYELLSTAWHASHALKSGDKSPQSIAATPQFFSDSAFCFLLYLNQLRKECPGGNHNWLIPRETVSIDIVGVHGYLEGVWRAGLFLKDGQTWRQTGAAMFGLDQHPGIPVANHHKIHLALLGVSDVAQFKHPEPEIGPPFHGFQ